MELPISLLVNSLCLLITFWLTWRMYTAANVYMKNQGDSSVQTRQKWKILWSIMILLILGLGATIFNFVVAFTRQ